MIAISASIRGMCEPAKTIIEICGGYAATAGLVGRSEARVRRWEYPRERGGTGGLIPSDAAMTLMGAARRHGIPLTPDHFFPGAGLSTGEAAA